jgi:hypothetical protein
VVMERPNPDGRLRSVGAPWREGQDRRATSAIWTPLRVASARQHMADARHQPVIAPGVRQLVASAPRLTAKALYRDCAAIGFDTGSGAPRRENASRLQPCVSYSGIREMRITDIEGLAVR